MNLKSSKEVIGSLISDINLDIADIEHRVFEWINMALDIMDITKHYTYTRSIVDIEDGIGKLPCKLDNLHSVWIKNSCDGFMYLNITGSPLIYERSDFYPMPNNLASIDGNFIRTSFTQGKVLFVHKEPPVDCDGYPMIPKSAKLDEALMYYIIYRMALKGYVHPIVDFETAYNRWNMLYVGAANDVEWFTLPELEEFTRLWSTIHLDSTTDNLYIN